MKRIPLFCNGRLHKPLRRIQEERCGIQFFESVGTVGVMVVCLRIHKNRRSGGYAIQRETSEQIVL